MGRLSLLAGSLNAHFPFLTGGSGDNLTQQSVAKLYKQPECGSSSGSCCDLVINLGHDDDNYYHIFNLHSSSPGDNNTLFVSSQVISQHINKSVSLASWLLFQEKLMGLVRPSSSLASA